MNTCLLDLGNTRYKWIRRSKAACDHPFSGSYREEQVQAGIVADILTTTPCDRLVVSSVRGDAFNLSLEQAFMTTGGREIRWAALPESPPFQLAYSNPLKFGIDRYLNLLAAMDEYALPVIVVSAGTAVTVDVLDASSVHLGGIIFPGLGLLKKALTQGTQLVTADDSAAVELFGTSTEAGVNGGAFYGLQGAVSRITLLMLSRVGGHATIIITGGDAELLLPALQSDAVLDSNLLLKGLSKI